MLRARLHIRMGLRITHSSFSINIENVMLKGGRPLLKNESTSTSNTAGKKGPIVFLTCGFLLDSKKIYIYLLSLKKAQKLQVF